MTTPVWKWEALFYVFIAAFSLAVMIPAIIQTANFWFWVVIIVTIGFGGTEIYQEYKDIKDLKDL